MEIIDLCSDSEDDVKLCSKGKGITHLCSEDRKDNVVPIDGVDSSLLLLNTPFAKNNAQQPITLDDDDWISSNHASCSYRSPAGSSHRIYPLSSSSLMLYDSSYGKTKQEIDDDDDIYMYSVPPQSFPISHPSLSDEEDLTARFNYVGTSADDGTGMFSSATSVDWKPPFGSSQVKTDSDNDDVYAYEGPHSHRMFPPSMPSFNPVNGPEFSNGFSTQSHPNGEKRPLGCDERAIYEEALQHISQETKEEDLPEGVLSISLLKHQRIALAWMLSKENSSHCPGGILADDQGLGKTISTISLIQKERVQQSNFMSADSDSKNSVPLDLDDDDIVMAMDKKEPSDSLDHELCSSLSGSAFNNMAKNVKVEPRKKARVGSASISRSATRPSAGTLVVCPASILKQWASEIKAKVTESSRLSVLVYHGSSRTTKPTELAKYDVVVTTYTIVGQEVPKQDSDDDMEPNIDEKYGICPDFAARKKRKLSKQTKKKAIKKKKLSSSDADLGGGPLARVRWFRVVLDEAQTIKNHHTKSARACCGLKAKRRWCLSGTPMQNTIDDLYSYFRFLKYEPYSSFSLFRSMIKGPISRGSSQGYKKLQTVLKIILLRRTKETLLDGEPIIKVPPKTIELKKINFTQEERYFYLALEEGSREKFKEFAAAGTIKQNYANILVLLLRLRQACDHPYLLKDMSNKTNYTDPASIEMAKQLPREIVMNLLEKLEVRRPICMICAEHRNNGMESRTGPKEPPENAVITTCCHIFCYECAQESLSEEEVCPVCKQKLCSELLFSRPVLRLCISDELESYATAAGDSSAAAAAAADSSVVVAAAADSSAVVAAASAADSSAAAAAASAADSSAAAAAADESSSICEASYISSKIKGAVDTLKSIFNTHGPADSDTPKAIVFSQWTGMLNVLELSLNSNFINFRRLDGSMSLDDREEAVQEFKADPEVRVMLMSLKAGNLGLNMIAASHVIMLDPWWNPYAEDQAVDRAHRIGQTRPVTVTRFTVNGTVEDRILALQAKKREMVESAFGEKSGGISTRLTVEDLGYLFNI
ncbi:helicase-like transcription factor CHR28 [Hordeum vulgare subsp. vulgare]|uniref:Helicase-like transcription factor CHR28 n=1 Tax=Hordeum vulgare subsp. vulgare TaxID=112509 RepID=A0A8I6XH82_HORVV|nr:helicase-like transcription factor CHR28 [Hordeum vulgare subsp. vulgare]